jgi:hypothetical protein
MFPGIYSILQYLKIGNFSSSYMICYYFLLFWPYLRQGAVPSLMYWFGCNMYMIHQCIVDYLAQKVVEDAGGSHVRDYFKVPCHQYFFKWLSNVCEKSSWCPVLEPVCNWSCWCPCVDSCYVVFSRE